MRFIKRSTRKKPKVSLVLLDWSVRESFHLLHYLGGQNVDRDQFEVVFIEYYSREAAPLKEFAEQVDTWLLLEMPEDCIYHKHLMYNCGIVFCHGEIVMICDSDAMVRESFIQTIIHEFEKNDRIILHLDQFRNSRKDFYPFNYPSFDDVQGAGCINNVGGKTKGIVDTVDSLHSRNYGACMCAKRADLIAIGGADEHLNYLGHICGPYEMTFRLVHYGLKEIWHEDEYLYHTWHPGQAGVDNYKGPHDGMHMSSTALEALVSKRVRPLVENRAIQLLRRRENADSEVIESVLIDQQYIQDWNRARVKRSRRDSVVDPRNPTYLYKGFKIISTNERYYASPLIDAYLDEVGQSRPHTVLESSSLTGVLKCIDYEFPYVLYLSQVGNAFCWNILWPLMRAERRVIGYLRRCFRRERIQALWNDVEGLQKKQLGWQVVTEFCRRCVARCLAVKENVASLMERTSYMTRWTNSIVANIYFLRKLAAVKRDKLLLLTTSRYLEFYLKALTVTKVLPKIRITRLNDRDDVKACLERLTAGGDVGPVILTRDVYFGHYGLVQSFSQIKATLVI